MSETRVCRTCGVEKEIEAFAFTGSGHIDRRRTCRTCRNEMKRLRGLGLPYPHRVSRPHVVFVPPPIPESDPWLDLAVIDACWSDCVAEGPEATRRMLDRLSQVWRLATGAAVGLGYLPGTGDLEIVRASLDGLLALARSA